MSFPYLSDLAKALTGYDLPLPLPMFGLFVAMAMVVASDCFRRELQRLHDAHQIGTARRRIKGKDGGVVEVQVPPQDIVTDLTVTVMIVGIIGARLFHILDHTDMFLADPWGMIFNRSGLSIFGGLILGTLAGVVCIKHWRLPIRPLLDAVAPSMMLGYAIGRIGCQVSGDGDWGIVSDMSIKPDWLPTWVWAQTCQHNILGAVIQSPGVYPTPMYETLMGLACFLLLWCLRKHPFQMGWLFSIYLLLAGVERFLIEKIRVNPMIDVGGFHATQAEIIAVILVIIGLVGIGILGRRLARHSHNDQLNPPDPSQAALHWSGDLQR